jgi:hypothetical protein
MIMKPLPPCICPDARPFTPDATKALLIDEIGNIAEDRGGCLQELVWSRAALGAMSWWAGLDQAERKDWRLWISRDIQRDDLAPLLRNSRE